MKEIKPHRSIYDLKKSPPYEGPFTRSKHNKHLDIIFAICIGIALGFMLATAVFPRS
jgi:hypothetical protein